MFARFPIGLDYTHKIHLIYGSSGFFFFFCVKGGKYAISIAQSRRNSTQDQSGGDSRIEASDKWAELKFYVVCMYIHHSICNTILSSPLPSPID